MQCVNRGGFAKGWIHIAGGDGIQNTSANSAIQFGV
jgi:hypothetical protein